MANVLVQESSLQAIAEAIRAKNGTENTYTPAQMGPAIAEIEGGGSGSGGYDEYLYYRLYITRFCRTNTDTAQPFQNLARFCVIGEGGVDLAQLYGEVFTASSEYDGSPASNAFDGDIETLWESDWKNSSDTTGWIQVQLDKSRAAVGFAIGSRASQRDYPVDALIQGSNDGETWTTLVTLDETLMPRDGWKQGCLRTFAIFPQSQAT